MKFSILLIYLWLCWIFVAAHKLPPVAGHSGLSCCRAPVSGDLAPAIEPWPLEGSAGGGPQGHLCFWVTPPLPCLALSWYLIKQVFLNLPHPQKSPLTGPRVRQWSHHTGSAALQDVESSQIRDQTCVPSTGRQIPNHWTTGEV